MTEDLKINNPEDILTVLGWSTRPDRATNEGIVIVDSEDKEVTTVYCSDLGVTVAWGETTVAMSDLFQAYSWVLSQNRDDLDF